MAYGRLEIAVVGDTRPLEANVRGAAQRAGQQAAADIGKSMSRGMRGVQSVLSGVGKAAATGLTVATGAAVTFGVQSFRTAARIGTMDKALQAMATANKTSYASMQSAISGMRQQGIATSAAQSVVASFTRGQLDLSKAQGLARVAQDAATVTGRNASQVVSDLTRGIMTQNVRLLRNAGVSVDVKKAQADYAAQLGISVKNMTSSQKAQAVLNGVLQNGQKIAGTYAAAMREPGRVLQQFPVVIESIRESVGQGLVRALGPAVVGAFQLANSLASAMVPGGKLAPIFDAIGNSVGRLVGWIGPLAEKWAAWIKGLSSDQVSRIAGIINRIGPAAMVAAGGLSAMVGGQVLRGIPGIGGALEGLIGPLAKSGGLFATAGKAAAGMVPGLRAIIPGAGQAAAGLGGLAGPLALAAAGFALLMAVSPAFRSAIMDLVAALGAAFQPVLVALVGVIRALVPPFTEIAVVLGSTLAVAIRAVLPIINALAQVLIWLGPALPPLTIAVLAGAAAWKVYQGAMALIDLAKLLPFLVQYALGINALTVQTIAGAVASKVAAAAQWLWNAAMTANPIGIVVVAIAALVAGLIIAYTKIGWFRALVQSAWAAILAATNWLVGAFKTLVGWILGGSPGLVPAFLALLGPIGLVVAAFTYFRGNLGGLVGAVRGAWSFLTSATASAWSSVATTIASNFARIGANVGASLAWVQSRVAAGYAAVLANTRASWSAKAAAIAANFVRIGANVGASMAWIQARMAAGWAACLAGARSAWNAIVNTIASIFNRLGAVVAGPIRAAVGIINRLINGINGLITKIGIPKISPIAGFATGGKIPGHGRGDRQIIAAEAGEWMLTRRQAQAIGYANLARLPRYATGGGIGPLGPELPGTHDRPMARLPSLRDLGGAFVRITHLDQLANAGKALFDDFTGMLTWAASQAFKVLTEPLKKAVQPWAGDPQVFPKQWLGKTLVSVIDKAVEFIAGKAMGPCGSLGGGDVGGIVGAALKYNGRPYRWGGGANPSTGFDCSSFVSYIAGHYGGLPLPGGFRVPSAAHGPVTTDYLRWGGMTTVPLSAAKPGSVAVSPTHIGFLIGPGGSGFAARSTATGIGPQNFARGYTYRMWNGGGGTGGGGADMGICDPGSGQAGFGYPGNVESWRGLVTQMANRLGIPWTVNAWLAQIRTESGGNAGAIQQVRDINWPNNKAQGLLQVIPTTFRAYCGPYCAAGPLNAAANVFAAMSYAISRYGKNRLTSVIGRGHGYAEGGIIGEPIIGIGLRSGDPYSFGERGRELVSPLEGAGYRNVGGAGRTVINVYPTPGMDERQVAAMVSRELAWAAAGGSS
jgi:hypothetical protein